MGTGAVMATSLFSATDLNQQGSPVPGPMAVFIAVRPGVSGAAALRSLDHIAAVLDRPSDPDAPVGGVVSALRPAEIADYRTVGATPALLAAVLAVGAIGALGLTLVASVRQRRRQFALLKALGFTQRQLAASVAWQSSVAAVLGVVLGVPSGSPWGAGCGPCSPTASRPCRTRRCPSCRWRWCAGGGRLRQPGRPAPGAGRRQDAHLAAPAGGVTGRRGRQGPTMRRCATVMPELLPSDGDRRN